jgi:two-component system, NarL family, invasion response regulator UvrY
MRIALFQSSSLISWALREALAPRKTITVVGISTTVEQATKLAKTENVDVLLSEIDVIERNSYGLLTAIANVAKTRVVALTGPDDDHRAARALRLGCNGFVDFDASAETLIDALNQAAAGKIVATSKISRLAETNADSPTAALSQREVQVMEMLANGQTNREIADALAISVKTIDTHRGHVLKKLQLRNNSDLTRFAVKHGLIQA